MISIITPVYNGEQFIEKCIQTVIEQRCPEVEHIIVDGGSSDRTVSLIQKYAAEYPHIRWVSEKDRGQSDAMNKGITLAKGEILGFLNADDYYEPDVLNRVLDLFQSLPEPSFLVGNCHLWDDAGNLTEINRPTKLKLADLLMGWHVNPHPANPSAYFYHKSLHQQVGLYDVNDHYSMDLDFILRVVSVAHVKYVDETWGNFQLLRTTKTFQSNSSGLTDSRIHTVMKRYRKQVSLWEQSQIMLKADLPRIFQTASFFLNNPKELMLTVRRKWVRSFTTSS